jgi:hypothetical protein
MVKPREMSWAFTDDFRGPQAGGKKMPTEPGPPGNEAAATVRPEPVEGSLSKGIVQRFPWLPCRSMTTNPEARPLTTHVGKLESGLGSWEEAR